MTSDPVWLKVVPMVLSVVAILVSLASASFTAYQQYFKRPQITLVPGKTMLVWRDYDMTFVFSIALALRNSGARSAAVREITGTLRMPDQYESSFTWRMFMESKSVGPSGTFKAYDDFTGWAETLIVPARSAVQKRIQFVTRRAIIVVEGEYQLVFKVFEGVGAEPAVTLKVAFTLTRESVPELLAAVGDPARRIVETAVIIDVRLADHGTRAA